MDEDGHFFHSPSISISVKDVSGAGDAVAAILGLGLAEKISMPDLAKLANLAGGLACEEVGVTPVARAKIIEKWPHF